MKILIVAESIDVEDSSGSKANVALIKNLHKAGFDIQVYHYTRKNIELAGIPCFEIKEKRSSLLFFLSRLERYTRYYTKFRLHRPLEKLFGFSFTLFNDRNSIVKSLRKHIDFKPDFVLTLSKGGSFRPHHALLKMPEWYSRWIAYIHDPYPMHHYPKPYTWYEPGYEKKEQFIRQVSEKAAISAFPSLLLKQWMGKFYPNFLNTGIVIPHQIFEKSKKGLGVPDQFIPENFNVLHAGNLLGARKPEFLIAAWKEFLRIRPDARQKSLLIFLGGNNINLLNKKSDIKNVWISRNYIEFEKVLRMQELAAVNVILEARGEFSPFLPGKFPHCIQANKPILILGPKESEVRRLLGYDYPYFSESDDIEGILKNILKLYDEWKVNYNSKLYKDDLKSYLGVDFLRNEIEKLKY